MSKITCKTDFVADDIICVYNTARGYRCVYRSVIFVMTKLDTPLFLYAQVITFYTNNYCERAYIYSTADLFIYRIQLTKKYICENIYREKIEIQIID